MVEAFDAVCIGNAIVDVLAPVDETFITEHGLNKASMTLIDADRAEYLSGLMSDPTVQSGGSAGNTAAGIAALGGSSAYIGKVRDDELGAAFASDIQQIGVTYNVKKATVGAPTARSFIFVTPDAERTMNTYLGACLELSPSDIDEAQIAAGKVTYLEGYLWDPPLAKEAFRKAIAIAHAAGQKTSLSLSDPFCVGRFRHEFLELLTGDIDLLFANADEVMALFETDDLRKAVDLLRDRCEVAAITCGARGSIIVAGAQTFEVAADPVENLVDTTGAGDLYAAGFLTGYARGLPLADCGWMGSVEATKVIQHFGARES